MKACWCGWMVRPAPRRVMVFRAVRAMVSVDGVAGWSGSFPSGFSVGGGVHLSAGVAPAVPVPILQRTCQPGTRNPPTGPSTTSTTPPAPAASTFSTPAPSTPGTDTTSVNEDSTVTLPATSLLTVSSKLSKSPGGATIEGDMSGTNTATILRALFLMIALSHSRLLQ